MSPSLLAAHYRLAEHRPAGESRVAVYWADEPGGWGPALQVVTGHGAMLMDSVTVLLHRLGVAYEAIMNPIFDVHRNTAGDVLTIEPESGAISADAVEETWIHVQLSPSVNRAALANAERLLPGVLVDVCRVAADSVAMIATLNGLVEDLQADREDRYPGPDRQDVAALLCWLADGNFMVLGYQRCPVMDGIAAADESNSLGVLRDRKNTRRELTDDNKLLTLVQASVPSYLRYGAYPYIVVVRENGAAGVCRAPLYRPVHCRRHERRRAGDPGDCSPRSRGAGGGRPRPSHPGQLLLDVIQTVPRAELFALSSERLLAMAEAVVDLGSRRRTLLFVRADSLEHFVSCLVYLPRDRYTTAVRLEIEDILVREFGGTSLEFTARVTESPWALMHFMVRLGDNDSGPPGVDTSEENRVRIQGLLTEAARTWADRLIGAATDGAVDQSTARTLCDRFFRGLQTVRHAR